MTDQPPTESPERNRWRGRVDTTLIQVDSRLGTMELEVKETNKTLSGMPAKIAKVIKDGNATPGPGNGQPITFKWITEKFLLPIILLIASLIIAAAVNGALQN